MKKTFIVEVICVLCLSNSGFAAKTIPLTVASCNVLHEDYFDRSHATANMQNKTNYKRITLKKRTALFKEAVEHGPLARADVVAFQEWPNPNNDADQGLEWERILENSGFSLHFAPSSKSSQGIKPTDGVLIAYKKSKLYTVTTIYTFSNIFFLARQGGGAIAVILKIANSKTKIGVMNIHLQNNPTEEDTGFSPFCSSPNVKNALGCLVEDDKSINFHLFRCWQLDTAKKLCEHAEKEEAQKDNSKITWIITGDFNWDFEKNSFLTSTNTSNQIREEFPSLIMDNSFSKGLYNYNLYLRNNLCFPRSHYTDTDTYAETNNKEVNNKKLYIATAREGLDEYAKVDFMFYSTNNSTITQKTNLWFYPSYKQALLAGGIDTDTDIRELIKNDNSYKSLVDDQGKPLVSNWHFSDHTILVTEFAIKPQ